MISSSSLAELSDLGGFKAFSASFFADSKAFKASFRYFFLRAHHAAMIPMIMVVRPPREPPIAPPRVAGDGP